LTTREDSPVLIPTPVKRSRELHEQTPPPQLKVSWDQEAMINIHPAVIQKLENEKIYMNLVEILTDRVFFESGNPAQFRKAIMDELAGRWGASMWD